MSGPVREAAATASLWRSVRMVAWAFFGIRKSSESKEDMAQIKPAHIIVVGLALAVVFVLGLVALVQWVVGQ